MNYLVVREHQECASSSRLHDTCDELGVYTAEERVPGGLGDANVVIALLPLEVDTIEKVILSTAGIVILQQMGAICIYV